jgi:hypothetical protein
LRWMHSHFDYLNTSDISMLPVFGLMSSSYSMQQSPVHLEVLLVIMISCTLSLSFSCLADSCTVSTTWSF